MSMSTETAPPRRSLLRWLGRHRSSVLVELLIVLVAAFQWPMLKGMYYRFTGVPVPAGSIRWYKDFDNAQAEAKRAGKPLLVDFSATWCPPCEAMKHKVWPDAEVGKAANEGYVALYVDVDENEALARRYHIELLPTILVMDADGKVLRGGNIFTRDELIQFLRASNSPG